MTNKSVEPGNYVQVGQPLFAIVPPQVWVTANFKETQLTDMRRGQPAEVDVDAYPARALRGHVDSIQAGQRRALQPAPAGERDRQLRQGRAARAGEDRAR